MKRSDKDAIQERPVRLNIGQITLDGDLAVPVQATGIILFAHGSGSSRLSSRNRYVAHMLQSEGFATLLFDLLARHEEDVEQYNEQLRFDIPLLAGRLVAATQWVRSREDTKSLDIGYFGSSTGAAAALIAETQTQEIVRAVVSRGGRPDLAGRWLGHVKAPTLFIVGGHDDVVLSLNRQAMARMNAAKELVIVPGATHLFEEPGALESAARLAAEWFGRYLRSGRSAQ
jgi:dienelactone hydrolase